MRSIGFSLALFLSSFALAPLAHAQSSEAPAPIDLSAYGSLPEVEQATISPSGIRIALVTTIDGQRVILAIENQEKAIAKMGVGDAKIRWNGSVRIVCCSPPARRKSLASDLRLTKQNCIWQQSCPFQRTLHPAVFSRSSAILLTR
jgi:hypothetical protein